MRFPIACYGKWKSRRALLICTGFLTIVVLWINVFHSSHSTQKDTSWGVNLKYSYIIRFRINVCLKY